MGYFDYLDQKGARELRDSAFVETYNKVALYVNFGAIGLTLLAVILFCFISVGAVIWLDILLAAGMTAGIVAMVYANSVRNIVKRKHKKDVLANFIFVWSAFWVLINVIMCVMNTWMYFA